MPADTTLLTSAHPPGRATEGARQLASDLRYRSIRVDSPICEVRTTSGSNPAQISLHVPCTSVSQLRGGRFRASRCPTLACRSASPAQFDPPTNLAPALPSASELHSFSSSYLLSPGGSFLFDRQLCPPTILKGVTHRFQLDSGYPLGIAIPYGIYDVRANQGSVFIGVSHDTPAFAVNSLSKWWRYDGQKRYRKRPHVLVLADCGGSNGPRNRAWKHNLQHRLCDPNHVTVTVCHYPSGASKWNPVEHRLFSQISRNWAGRPLDSYDTICNYIRNTTTQTGLTVKAYLDHKHYPTAVKIPDHEVKRLRCQPHHTLPHWNYTLKPRNR